MKRIVFITSLFALLLSFGYAGTDGTIRGRVTDEDGNGLPGAQVFMEGKSLGVMADNNGNYLILNIPVGNYSVSVRMIGYQKQTRSNIEVIMDKTIWLNFTLPIDVIGIEEVIVTGEKELVEKGATSKKITFTKEVVEALVVRDMTDIMNLNSGVVKVESRSSGIPDHEERGLEEIHVRGGRSGEIAYMIDGLYIRNPIFGGIGNGTRLNLFAVKEYDFQPGSFNAEYGDAMSAVSNMHTFSGEDHFQLKMKYETSLLGAKLGNQYDELRGFNDIMVGFGGPVLGIQKLRYWVSAQITDHENYRVYKFDDLVYNHDLDIVTDEWDQSNMKNLVQPWDDVAGFKGFGLDKTKDVFAKLSYNITSSFRMNISYWQVAAHRKGFNPTYLYWDKGQNELFRDTYRYTTEINHSINDKSFYTIRMSRFVQDQFQGVRWQDSDKDGYPDWFEWRYPSGEGRKISDPYNPYITPNSVTDNGDTVFYTMLDSRSGWYYGATPGLYNWEVAEGFRDINGNGVYDEGVDLFNNVHDINGNGRWDGPELSKKARFRDGNYWLEPEMYINYEDFFDYRHIDLIFEQDPYWSGFVGNKGPRSSPFYYYMPWGVDSWVEGRTFGGHDRFYGTSTAETNEIRLDYTNQLTNEWRARIGMDYKTHKLNFYEVKKPWLREAAFTQSFAEFWEDTGPDGLAPGDPDYVSPDFGESNGQWDPGEKYTDSNENNKWDDFREPVELSGYIQNTYEVPWMVVHLGLRFDAVNYNTQIWADTLGNMSPGKPWYFSDVGQDGKNNTGDMGEDDGIRNYNEPADENSVFANSKVLFTPSVWQYKFSPRLGFSHVITDKATFTFNYGVYYQTPIYQNIYLNTNRQEEPDQLFEEGEGLIGNATMSASRTQSYEFGFNIQFTKHWAFTLAGWVKDMDQLVTYKHQRSGVYVYQVFSNGDYGSAKGFDFTLRNRGQMVNTMLQYTYSIAKASSAYDAAAAGLEALDAPTQEFLMPYDRPHDLTLSMYTVFPFEINAGLTAFYQSGAPYTPFKPGYNRSKAPELDTKNKYSMRAPEFKSANLSLSKFFHTDNMKVTFGMNIVNIINTSNALDIWPMTGKANDPGEYYTDNVGLPGFGQDKSASFYDQPWKFGRPRQIDFFIKWEFK